MQYIIYFIISITATSIGALTGMGGGIIIKPILDTLGGDAASVGILSSMTVFTMAVVSVVKQKSQNEKLDMGLVISVAIGSIIGGVLGERFLAALIAIVRINRLIVAMQNVCLIFLIIAIFIYMYFKEQCFTLNLVGTFPAILAGVVLGMISSFLGIGGGPVNVALIIFLFGCSFKRATAYSIIVILFAQASKLSLVLINRTLFTYNLTMLPSMIVGAMLGGWIGSYLNQILPEVKVRKAFIATQAVVIVICLYNIFRNVVV